MNMNENNNDEPLECGICHSTDIQYYDGMLGYEAMRCQDCYAYLPIGFKDAKWIAYEPYKPPSP